MEAKSRQQELEGASLIEFTARWQRDGRILLLLSPFSMHTVQDPSQAKVPPTVGVSHTLIKIIKRILHRCAQRSASQMLLNSVR